MDTNVSFRNSQPLNAIVYNISAFRPYAWNCSNNPMSAILVHGQAHFQGNVFRQRPFQIDDFLLNFGWVICENPLDSRAVDFAAKGHRQRYATGEGAHTPRPCAGPFPAVFRPLSSHDERQKSRRAAVRSAVSFDEGERVIEALTKLMYEFETCRCRRHRRYRRLQCAPQLPIPSIGPRVSSSAHRPTNRVSPRAIEASKRLCAARAPTTRQALTALGKPLSVCRPRSSYSRVRPYCLPSQQPPTFTPATSISAKPPALTNQHRSTAINPI